MDERLLKQMQTDLEELKREVADLRSELELLSEPPSTTRANPTPNRPAEGELKPVTSRDWNP